MMKTEGSESGSISQRHGSVDPHPDSDPQQNVMDPQHWFFYLCCGSIGFSADSDPAFYLSADWNPDPDPDPVFVVPARHA
jgi:hypothetical protein